MGGLALAHGLSGKAEVVVVEQDVAAADVDSAHPSMASAAIHSSSLKASLSGRVIGESFWAASAAPLEMVNPVSRTERSNAALRRSSLYTSSIDRTPSMDGSRCSGARSSNPSLATRSRMTTSSSSTVPYMLTSQSRSRPETFATRARVTDWIPPCWMRVKTASSRGLLVAQRELLPSWRGRSEASARCRQTAVPRDRAQRAVPPPLGVGVHLGVPAQCAALECEVGDTGARVSGSRRRHGVDRPLQAALQR